MANVPQTYVQMLDTRREEIEKLLPSYLEIDRFIYNARTLARDPNLRDCTAESMFNCALDAARRGLELGGPNKHCYPVPFGKTCTLIISWQGKSFLWQRSGAAKLVRCKIVYTWDQFDYDAGENTISHRPELNGSHKPSELNDPQNMVGAYSIVTLWSGEKSIVFVSRDQMMRLMEWVKKKNNGRLGFGYTDWLAEMFCKTAVHRQEGFVQPPPNMTPEQIDAWNRAAQAEATNFDAEIEGRPVDANIDHPVDTKGNGAPQPGQAKTPEVMPDEDPADRPVNSDEIRELMKFGDEHGVPPRRQRAILKERFDVDDLAKLRAGYIGMFKACIEEAGNG